MDRLTYRGANGKGYVRNDGYYNSVYLHLERVAERLTAYEDTGLEPEEVASALRRVAEDDKARGTYQKALDTWGADAQTVMVFEEMAELQKELCKHARGRENLEDIAEEIADVLIMLEQMIILHGCAESVGLFKTEKLKRLEGRLAALGGGEGG